MLCLMPKWMCWCVCTMHDAMSCAGDPLLSSAQVHVLQVLCTNLNSGMSACKPCWAAAAMHVSGVVQQSAYCWSACNAYDKQVSLTCICFCSPALGLQWMLCSLGGLGARSAIAAMFAVCCDIFQSGLAAFCRASEYRL